jgi:inner membrane protein
MDSSLAKMPFAFEIHLKGSGGIAFAPLGKETVLSVSSPWQTPSFMGAFLPSSRELDASGFKAEWEISSFGRSYPQTWNEGDVSLEKLVDSAAGVDLHEQVGLYTKIFRSIKYAILFILITFASFFLFEVLSGVRIHPMQYFFIGAALALFYLLLLSLAEQIGFPWAYTIAAGMTAGLIAVYSSFVLHSRQRAMPIFGMLAALYGYLYFVLILEDYALLFGSFLVFALLATIMYLTRNLDWFSLSQKS